MADGVLLLSWKNHHSTFCEILSRHREKETFSDVTLTCEGKFYPVHKLVLSACSEHLEKILESAQCPHPVIVLHGIKCSELECLLNFMYAGEVNVPQCALSQLMLAAELLEIKGLAVPDSPQSSSPRRARGNNHCVSPPSKRRRHEGKSSEHGRASPVSSTPPPSVSSTHSKERHRITNTSEEEETKLFDIQEEEQTVTHNLNTEETKHVRDESVHFDVDVKEEVTDVYYTDELAVPESCLDYGNPSHARDDGIGSSNSQDNYLLPESAGLEHQSSLHHNQSLPQQSVALDVTSSELKQWSGVVEEVGMGTGYPLTSDLEDATAGMDHTTPQQNHHVVRIYGSVSGSGCRGGYNRWSPEERLQIAAVCTRLGPTNAARELSKQFRRKLSESTVRNIHKRYLKMVKAGQQKDHSVNVP